MRTDTHEGMLRPAEAGCLLLADVSGYTAYLRDTELEHAHDVLADLTETVVERLRPTLRVAKLEGDAVFAYAPGEDLDGSMLLDTVDQTYFAFRARSRDVAQATSCDCRACRLIPSLDLKFVVHDGRFVRQRVAGGEELTGADVVLVHRLLKNRVRERLGLTAYALLTEACTAALEIDPGALGLAGHQERYDDLGEVRGWVEDLEARWRAEQERRRVSVSPEEAEFEMVRDLPVPAPLLWEYQTSPEKRLLWQTEFTRIDQTNPEGRRGAGTTNHCVHGRETIVEEILDWQPFRYFTIRTGVPMIGPWTFTFGLEELEEGGTRLRIRPERLTGLRRRALWALMRPMMRKNLRGNLDRLAALLEEPD